MSNPSPIPSSPARAQAKGSARARAASQHQRELLAFIRRFVSEHGWAPSIREMMAALEISSTSVVNYRLVQLELGGHIYRERGTSRAIRLIKQAQDKLGGKVKGS